MSWKPEADEILRRRELAAELGGSEAVERQHGRGRGTVRERIDALIDRDRKGFDELRLGTDACGDISHRCSGADEG